MCACHGNHQGVSVYGNNIPRRAKLLNFRLLIAFLVKTFLASAYNGDHFTSRQINFTNSMIFGITNVNVMCAISVNMAKTLRMMELCFCVAAVNKAYFTVTNNKVTLKCFFVDHNQTVVS